MRRLHNQVRHYHWGSRTAIPRLLGRAPDGRPHAELWLGAHAAAPSHVETSEGEELTPLNVAIEAEPEKFLGAEVSARFGARLPFLLKVLAARTPLSLQVHPDSGQAEAGFEAEEVAGVPRDAAVRNYPDPFHKPELLVALGSFDALCGFRAPALAEEDLGPLSGQLARELRRELGNPNDTQAIHQAVSRLLRLRTADPERLLDGFFGECAELAARRDVPDSLRTALDLACRFPGDPGAAIAFLLHRVRLATGDALLVPPGSAHAHLGGIALEIMSGSDNVIRAGLTDKHVDTAGVLDVADFATGPMSRLDPVRDRTGVHYATEYPEFGLHLVGGGRDAVVPADSPALILVLTGTCLLRGRGAGLKLQRGASAFVTAAGPPVDLQLDGYAVVATVGSVCL